MWYWNNGSRIICLEHKTVPALNRYRAMKKNLLIVGLIVVLSAFLGWVLKSKFSARQSITEVTSSTIINQIKNVSKLVTVEGQISEIYSHKDKKPIPFTWSYSEKKAIVKVEAKVLVGYDLEKMTFLVDEQNKTITITSLPNPEVISIDDNISYYDIENGYFNTFSESDYTNINKKVKEMIRSMANKSDMMGRAEAQGLTILASFRNMMKLADWTLIFPQGTKVPEMLDLQTDSL